MFVNFYLPALIPPSYTTSPLSTHVLSSFLPRFCVSANFILSHLHKWSFQQFFFLLYIVRCPVLFLSSQTNCSNKLIFVLYAVSSYQFIKFISLLFWACVCKFINNFYWINGSQFVWSLASCDRVSVSSPGSILYLALQMLLSLGLFWLIGPPFLSFRGCFHLFWNPLGVLQHSNLWLFLSFSPLVSWFSLAILNIWIYPQGCGSPLN